MLRAPPSSCIEVLVSSVELCDDHTHGGVNSNNRTGDGGTGAGTGAGADTGTDTGSDTKNETNTDSGGSNSIGGEKTDEVQKESNDKEYSPLHPAAVTVTPTVRDEEEVEEKNSVEGDTNEIGGAISGNGGDEGENGNDKTEDDVQEKVIKHKPKKALVRIIRDGSGQFEKVGHSCHEFPCVRVKFDFLLKLIREFHCLSP